MNKKTITKNAEAFVKKALENESSGHDWWHIERVRNNARLINSKEKADDFTIDLALLLHDVGDRKVINKEQDDYTIAENFLISQKISEEIIAKIMFIIKNMSFSTSIDKTHINAPKEFFIAQDADRLDAIGAIGIARTFAYGGNKQRPLYDPTIKVTKVKSTKQYKNLNSSTLHHFEEKLFKLEDLMNTKTAQKIARNRDIYMQKFVQEFLAEWDGRM